MSKRENRIGEARLLYEAAVSLRPDEPQVWLDFSKMEEDVGESERCNAILQEGLRNCEGNEVLLTRAVKQAERQGRIQQARELLSRLQSVDMPPEKAWRTVLEGAQMEARAGNQKIARKVFKYLMKHVPWCVRVVALRGVCRRPRGAHSSLGLSRRAAGMVRSTTRRSGSRSGAKTTAARCE